MPAIYFRPPLYHTAGWRSLYGVLSDVAEGRLGIARFSQPAPWDEEDALELLDGLAAGLPIGLLTVADARQSNGWGATPFGHQRRPAEDMPTVPSYVVVDGARRLAIIADLLTPLAGGAADTEGTRRRHVDLWAIARGVALPDAMRVAPGGCDGTREDEFMALAFPLTEMLRFEDWERACRASWPVHPGDRWKGMFGAHQEFWTRVALPILSAGVPVCELRGDTDIDRARSVRRWLNSMPASRR
jgi:hypothetical protein